MTQINKLSTSLWIQSNYFLILYWVKLFVHASLIFSLGEIDFLIDQYRIYERSGYFNEQNRCFILFSKKLFFYTLIATSNKKVTLYNSIMIYILSVLFIIKGK